MSVELFHRRSGNGPSIVLLHGLFGSSDNWGTVARDLTNDFDVTLVDLRDHGRSPHTELTDYPLMAEDVHALFQKLELKQAVLAGHSMGGKTAMVFAQRWRDAWTWGRKAWRTSTHAEVRREARAVATLALRRAASRGLGRRG